MRGRIIQALIAKQAKDMIKNVPILLLFIIYPIVALVVANTMSSDDVSPRFFISIFATMHGIFAPLMAASGIVAEEKEKKTLRELILSNVTTAEFLLSIGFVVFLCTVITGVSFIFIGSYEGSEAWGVLALVAVSSLLSIVLGMSIGAIAKNTSSVTAYTMPLAFVLSFGPMLAAFNDTIKSVTKFTYGQHISDWFSDMSKVSIFGCAVITVNFIIILAFFFYAFARNKRDRD